MTRASASRFVAVAVATGLMVMNALSTKDSAQAESADRMLAEKLLGPGDLADPVLAALSEGRLIRDVAAPAVGQVELPPVPIGFALTGVQLGPLNVTGTPLADQEVNAFVSRLRGRGISIGNPQWTVYTLPPVKEAIDAGGTGDSEGDGPMNSALIVPPGTKIEMVGAIFENGQLHAKTVFSATPSGSASAGRAFRPMAAPSDSASFIRAGGLGCVERKQNNTAWYDPCQDFHLLQNDGDPNRRYWANEMRGTGKGRGIWTLNGLEVSSRRADGSPAQEWVDWDPGADSDRDCHPQTVGVGYAGASVSVTQQHCEMWDIDKDEDGADFANWWRGHVRRKERETAAFTLTRLANGDAPTLILSFDYYANP